MRKPLLALGMALAAASAHSQPYKVGWNRNFTEVTGLDIQVEFHSNGTMTTGFLDKGSIVLRNYSKLGALTASRTIAPPNGGTFHDLRLDSFGNGPYTTWAVASLTPAGGADSLYIAKLGDALTLDGEKTSAMTPAGGTERVTDLVADGVSGDLVFVGEGQNGGQFDSFVGRLNTLGNFEIQIVMGQHTTSFGPTVDIKPGPNGIIAILIGLLVNNQATSRSISPTGTTNWSVPINGLLPYIEQDNYISLTDFMVSSYAFNGTDGQGQPTTFLRSIRRSATTGIVFADVMVASVLGTNQFDFRQTTVGDDTYLTGKRQHKPICFKLNSSLATLWTRTSTEQVNTIGDAFTDQFGFIYQALCTNENVQVFKYSSTGYRQASLIGDYASRTSGRGGGVGSNGDLVVPSNSPRWPGVTTFYQAPQAMNDSFSFAGGRAYTSSRSLTLNDRYAQGAALAIVKQPDHGTLTLYANGTFRYVATAGYTGADNFTYSLTKAGLSSSQATAFLTVR